jgi:hypothetical protein
MKKNIFDEYSSGIADKIDFEEKFFSQSKNSCVLLYNGRDVYKGFIFYYDFLIIYYDGEMLMEISSVGNLIDCWYKQDSVSWSHSGRYCSISSSVTDRKTNIDSEARLIVDIEEQRYTIIPLAGSRNYKVDFVNDNQIKISTKSFDWNREYIEILSKTADLNIFKWLPLSDIEKASDLFYQGYFGNIISGYKGNSKSKFINQDNIKPAWPYEDIADI